MSKMIVEEGDDDNKNKITNIFVYPFRYIDYMIGYIFVYRKKKRKKIGRRRDKGR